MSMPGAWPEEVEEVALSVEIESDAREEENEEDWLSRIDIWGLYPHYTPLDFATKDTPTGQPLAEPPMFNYDVFEREFVPSRKRFQILFPERRDVGKMTDYMDRHIERHILATYKDWVQRFLPYNDWVGAFSRPYWWYEYNEATNPTKEQIAFYNALRADLIGEEAAVYDEMLNIRATGDGSLEKWEFEYLDNDLQTTHIERELARLRDEIFECKYGIGSGEPIPEIRAKYQHLFPTDADDNFRHWHQRTKRALEKEVEESSQKMIVYQQLTTDGTEYLLVLRDVLLPDKPRAFGHGRVENGDLWELIRVYKNGRVLYPEYDTERGEDWLKYIPPK